MFKSFLWWLFSPPVTAIAGITALSIAFAMALATSSRNIRKAHHFFAISGIWFAGATMESLMTMKTSVFLFRPTIAFFAFGLIGAAWMCAYQWVEGNRHEYASEKQDNARVVSPPQPTSDRQAPTPAVKPKKGADAATEAARPNSVAVVSVSEADVKRDAEQNMIHFRIRLQNFGQGPTTVHLHFSLLLDSAPAPIKIGFPEKLALAPQQYIDLNLPALFRPDIDAAVWSGHSSVHLVLQADYDDGTGKKKAYRYKGRLNTDTQRLDTVQSDWIDKHIGAELKDDLEQQRRAKLQDRLARTSTAEKEVLRMLLVDGKLRSGDIFAPLVKQGFGDAAVSLDEICNKTGLLTRDFVGYYEIKPEFKELLNQVFFPEN